MTGDFAGRVIAHAEDDPRVYAIAQKITVKHGCALPADWPEHQNIC